MSGIFIEGVKVNSILFAVLVFLVGCAEKDPMESAVEWSKLQSRNGDAYIPNTDKPYNGWAKQNYDNEQVKVLAEFTDGSVTRLKQWQKNGIPKWDIGYSKGKVSLSDVPLEEYRDLDFSLQHGLYTWWHENGQKRWEGNYKDGKMDGLVSRWHENGQKKLETNFKDGKMDGLNTLWYESGQKCLEFNNKDDKMDGLHTVWYKNGQKKSETNLKDDKKDGLFIYWDEDGKKTLQIFFRNGIELNRKTF